MNKISILGLINEFNGLTKKDLIKKMLVFVETEFELTIAFLEYDGLYPVLHYLDDNMIIKSHQYNFLPQKSKELEVLVDVLSFKENDYFDGLSVYVKVPLETEDEDIGEIIFKIDHDESLMEGRKLTMNRLATEFSFLLNYDKHERRTFS